MVEYIKRLFLEIQNRVQTQHKLPFEDELIDCLKLKTTSEKNLLANHFCKLEWNLGSCHVLSIYQKLGILSATDYILRMEDEDQIQLVLNDFLETEYELLANLVINSYYDSVNNTILSVIIEECFRRLIQDTLNNDLLFKTANYLNDLYKLVQDDVYCYVSLLHCNILLNMNTIAIEECFKHFNLWITLSNHTRLQELLLPILTYKQIEVVQHLFDLTKQVKFKGWKFYIIILRLVGTVISLSTASYIKKYLKVLLKDSAIKSSKQILMNVIVTARSVCNTENENIGSYQLWYKNAVDDIKFSLDNNEFHNIIKCLSDIVQYEVEQNFLLVHINTGISAPPLCNEYVLNYKQLCKNKMLHLNNINLDKEDTILLSE